MAISASVHSALRAQAQTAWHRSRILLRHVTNPLLEERRIQAFCVGAPKTGTHSIASVFTQNYRSRHEPEPYRLIDWACRRANDDLGSKQIVRRLRWRDRRLWLDLESSHLLVFLIEELVACFPNAKFILTIRDCYSWLDSWLNQEISRSGLPDFWDDARKLRFGKPGPFPREEFELRERGLSHPISAYLGDWVRHNERVLHAVPSARLFVVRTEEIGKRVGELADFLEIPAATLSPGRAHEYRGGQAMKVADVLSREYLEAMFAPCLPLMHRFFPDLGPPSYQHG